MSGAPIVRSVAVSCALGLVVGYGTLCLIVSGPDNVVQQRAGGLAAAVMEPYGSQNWRLFAPSPISVGRGVRAWARCDSGETTAGHDLSAIRQRTLQQQRFFPAREPRTVSGPLSLIFDDDPLGHLSSARRPLDAEPVFDGYAPAALERYRRGERLIAAVAARDLGPSCTGEVDAVKLRYYVVVFPRWPDRDSPTVTDSEYSFDSGWVDVR